MSLLSILLKRPRYIFETMEVTGGEFTKTSMMEKGKVSDIVIYVEKYDLIIVLEMNAWNTDDIFQKNSEYAKKISILSTRRGKEKYIYKEVILINLNSFNKNGVKTPIQYFEVRDQNKIIECENGYNSIHLNLDRIIDTRYNKDVDEKVIRYAKYLMAEGIEEIKECAKGDEELMKTLGRIEEYANNPRMGAYYDYEENQKRMLSDSLCTGIRKGREEGLNQGINIGRSEGISIGRSEGIDIGREEGRNEGINIGQKKLLKTMLKSMSIQELSKACNMDEASIQSLINS